MPRMLKVETAFQSDWGKRKRPMVSSASSSCFFKDASGGIQSRWHGLCSGAGLWIGASNQASPWKS